MLLGGLVGLDAVSCPQVMISRPLVAGALAGLLVGDPVGGMWAGLFLELLTIGQLPVGAARVWDAGPAAVVAGAAHAAAADPGSASLVVAVAAATLVGWAGGWTVHILRRINARVVAPLARDRASARAIAGRHLAAMTLDFVRAAVLTLAGVLAVVGLPGVLEGSAVPGPVAGWVLVGVAALALGSTVRVLSPRPGARFAFGGAALVALMLWWLV